MGSLAPDSTMAEAIDIVSNVPLIDGHNDWMHLIRAYYDFQLDERFDADKSLVGHVDVQRLVEGKAGAVFWSLFVNCPTKLNAFDDETHFEILRDTLQQIDLLYRVVEKYSNHMEIVHKAADIMRIFKEGKCASLIGVEGLHQIGNSSSVLRMYHKLGVRYITLAHNKNNPYADSATSPSPAHEGLSAKGKAMVQEMNRIGMIIDLSHTSDAAMISALETSVAPVIFSHSSAYGVHPSPRNVPDVVLDLLKKNNGVIMICFCPAMTHAEPESASIDHVVDHILYVANRIGFEHLGLGSDYDGMERSVIGVEDVAKYPNLVAKMLERGIARSDVEKVIGLNVIRVMEDVEKVAKATSITLPVLQDEVKQLWVNEFRAWCREQYPNAEHDTPRA